MSSQAFGGNQRCYNLSFAGDERLLDDVVARKLQQAGTPAGTRLNSSVGKDATGFYAGLWARVGGARDAAGGLPRPDVLRFWAEAAAYARGGVGRGAGARAGGASMMVGLPTPRACNWRACVGATRPGGDCVCYGE